MNDVDHERPTDEAAVYAAQCERELIEQEAEEAKAARSLWKSVPADALCSPHEAAIIGGISEAELEQRVAAGLLPFPMNRGGFYLKPLECWQQTGMMLGDYAQQAAEQNEIRRFLNACCRRSQGGTAPAGTLHRAYLAWHAETTDGSSRFPLSVKLFRRRMIEIGMRSKRASRGNSWFGVELLPEHLPDEIPPTGGENFGDFGNPLRMLPAANVITLEQAEPVTTLATGD